MRKIVRLVIAFMVISLSMFAGGYYCYAHSAKYYISNANGLLEQLIENKEKIRRKEAERIIVKVFANLDEAIRRYPNRLDIWLGKLYVCTIIEQAECVEKTSISLLDMSAKNHNFWQWQNGEIKDKNFMLGNLNVYQNILFENKKDKALENIAKMAVKYYPEDVPNLNYLALINIFKGNYFVAEEILLKAQKIAPNDDVINQNMLQLKNKMNNNLPD